MALQLGRTTLTIYDETMARLVKIRGMMEVNDGKRRSLDDVISELTIFFENRVELKK